MANWIDRYWDKVEVRDADECWEWTGVRTRKGYGHLRVGAKMLRTHRLAWMLEHGKIPSGLCVCHHCDNPSCVNPSHLFVGTHADNAHDRDSKGRRQPPRGAKHGRARLTRENIQEIRALYATGEYLQRELGEQFGVSRGYVSQIVGREAWAWLE